MLGRQRVHVSVQSTKMPVITHLCYQPRQLFLYSANALAPLFADEQVPRESPSANHTRLGTREMWPRLLSRTTKALSWTLLCLLRPQPSLPVPDSTLPYKEPLLVWKLPLGKLYSYILHPRFLVCSKCMDNGEQKTPCVHDSVQDRGKLPPDYSFHLASTLGSFRLSRNI